MPTDIANLRVRVGAETSGLTKGMRGALLQVEALKVGVRVLGAGLRKLSRFMGESVKAAGVQESAMVALTSAMRQAGDVAADETAAGFAKYAAALQETTAFGDEVIIQSASIAASFGITGDALERTTEAALDLSVRTGQDLKSAMILLGKAAKGETGTLSRYGIMIDQNLPKSAKFEAALKEINKQFGGAAAAAAETYQGRVKKLSDTWGDFKEKIGEAVQGNKLINAALGVVRRTIGDMSEGVKQNSDLIQQWISKGWLKLFDAIDIVLVAVGFLVKMFQGLKIVGTTVLLLLAKGWQLQIRAIEYLLTPLSKMIDAMNWLAGTDFNPLAAGFEKVGAVLDTAIASFGEVLDSQLAGFEKIDPAFDAARETVANFKTETVEAAKTIGDAYREGVIPAIDATAKAGDKALTLLQKSQQIVKDNAESIGQGFVSGSDDAKAAIKQTIGALAAEAGAAAATKMFASAPPWVALIAAPIVAGIARGMVMKFANFDTGGVVGPSQGASVTGQQMAVVRDNEKIVPTGGPSGGGREGMQIVINQNFPTNRAELDKQVRDVFLPSLRRVGAF